MQSILSKNFNFKKIIKETAITLILVAVFATILSYFRQPELDSKTLENFQVTLLDGTVVHAEQYKGSALMLHFWGSWCPVCRSEAGNIERMAEHFNVLSIAVKSGTDQQIKAFMQEQRLKYPVYNDSEGKMAARYHITTYPTTFIYDKNGTLSFVEVGYTTTVGLYLRMWWASL